MLPSSNMCRSHTATTRSWQWETVDLEVSWCLEKDIDACGSMFFGMPLNVATSAARRVVLKSRTRTLVLVLEQ
jgi:hypothetical protein